jgi:hypothetical protein
VGQLELGGTVSDGTLYINIKGQPVTHASYSARQTFRHCPREFELTRIQGWSDKSHRAAPLFGKAVEAGVQAYEESKRTPGAGVAAFAAEWAKVKADPNFDKFEYTATEGNWEQLDRAGREMQRLYELRVPFYPISTDPPAMFQQVMRKKIFPGSELDKLENKAIIDIFSFPRWNHPRLPKIDPWPTNQNATAANVSEYRPLIIDCKTSGGDLDEYLVALDPQLAEYAWQMRVPDVAFLWFVKSSHGYKRGSRVSLLEDGGQWPAGFELKVVAVDDADDTGHCDVYVGLSKMVEAYEKEISPLRGKARAAAEADWLLTNTQLMQLSRVRDTAITKQRLQFAAARLTEKDMDECGRSVAQTTVEMVRAHEQQFYEKQGGIRFPNEKCNYCSMRWICLNNPDERDKSLTKRGEEWLDGLQGDD